MGEEKDIDRHGGCEQMARVFPSEDLVLSHAHPSASNQRATPGPTGRRANEALAQPLRAEWPTVDRLSMPHEGATIIPLDSALRWY